MKLILSAIIVIILVATQSTIAYSDSKLVNNSEITVKDVIIMDHQITDDSTNCFELNCAYEYYIRNQNDIRRLYMRSGWQYSVNGKSIALSVYR